MLEFGFYIPTKIHFGQGKVEEIGKITGAYGKRALVVTGKSSAKKFGFLQVIQEKLKKEGIEVLLFQQVEPNPSVDTVSKGAHLFKEEKCDTIIALGGGSCLDAAKVIGILAKNPDPLKHYFGKNKVKEEIPPLIAIPTTSGTGSEVTPYAVITDTGKENHPKKIIADPHIFPREAILDPALTISLTPSLTSDTGIDALSHAVESYLSKKAFPLSETIALEAIRTIGEYLPRTINNLEDMEARSYLMYAATLGGMAIALTGATILHAMGYPLTSNLSFPHGRANGILFPWFWEKSFPGNPEKFSKIIVNLDKRAKEYQIKDARESALLLKKFLHRSGLPESTDIKIEEKSLVSFTHEILKNKEKMLVSPKQLSFEEILDIYKKALLA